MQNLAKEQSTSRTQIWKCLLLFHKRQAFCIKSAVIQMPEVNNITFLPKSLNELGLQLLQLQTMSH